ncbi:hypothetical protein [Aliarcobacter butzleri]|uniref:hypothetical protein n=1 Tax=Aliarcobacter butzleri TaxID=28197 RepID=UPI001EDA6581|nr:hypothetical protein [Aliarcobacter butzleri]MCG3676149.1 hypothetical protein [Aliarcobacter butzleri]MCT7591365.1 hypothetical protein [Aliarcobacter butzleri]
MNKEERVFLEYFVDNMESKGLTIKTVHISFSEEELKEINEKYKTKITLEKMREVLNKLLSHEYLKRAYLNGDNFSGLELTLKGLGVVNSLRSKEETKKKRKLLKKISDYVEDHKGIFLVLGFLITVITLFLKFEGK